MTNAHAAPFDYVAEANVTCSNKFHGDLVSIIDFRTKLKAAMEALADLDAMKKTLFYGRALPPNFDAPTPATFSYSLPHMVDAADPDRGEVIVHGVIGLATEAGELLEALDSALDGEQFDSVNMQEEVGDAFWYQAILAKAGGFSFDTCQRRNIAKLRKRFPDKFTEHDALNRDLFGERAILEGGEVTSGARSTAEITGS